MEQKAMLEARVWSRITGEKLEVPRACSDISELLRQECEDLAFYRALQKKLPCHGEAKCLIKLAEENVKYLKTVYFVETGGCLCEENSEPVCISHVCKALRQRYLSVQKRRDTYEKRGLMWENAACNLKKQSRLLVCLLQKVL